MKLHSLKFILLELLFFFRFSSLFPELKFFRIQMIEKNFFQLFGLSKYIYRNSFFSKFKFLEFYIFELILNNLVLSFHFLEKFFRKNSTFLEFYHLKSIFLDYLIEILFFSFLDLNFLEFNFFIINFLEIRFSKSMVHFEVFWNWIS